jgi:hypothetical protein
MGETGRPPTPGSQNAVPIMSSFLPDNAQRDLLTFARSKSWRAQPSMTAVITFIPECQIRFSAIDSLSRGRSTPLPGRREQPSS